MSDTEDLRSTDADYPPLVEPFEPRLDAGMFALNDTPKPIDWLAMDIAGNRRKSLFRLEADFETITFGPEFKAALVKLVREVFYEERPAFVASVHLAALERQLKNLKELIGMSEEKPKL